MRENSFSTNNDGKLVALQCLRAFAFVGILLQHTSVLALGTWGVDVFFVLSGFVLTYSYMIRNQDLDISKSICFALKRIKKVYPVHIITLVGAMILRLYEMHVDGTLGEQISSYIKSFFLHVLLIQNWSFDEQIINDFAGVDWFLCAILFLYFCFPFMLKILRKYSKQVQAKYSIIISYVLLIGLSVCIEQYVDKYNLFSYFFPVYRLFEFWIGCNLGYLFSYSGREQQKDNTLMEVCVFICAVLSFCAQNYIDISLKPAVLYLPSTVGLIWCFAGNSGKLTTFLTRKWIVQVGNVSGNAFLISQVVLYYFQAVYFKIFGKIVDHYIMQAVIVFIITMLCAVLYNRVRIYLVNICSCRKIKR